MSAILYQTDSIELELSELFLDLLGDYLWQSLIYFEQTWYLVGTTPNLARIAQSKKKLQRILLVDYMVVDVGHKIT